MTTFLSNSQTTPSTKSQARRFAMALALFGGALVFSGHLQAQVPTGPEPAASAAATASAVAPAPNAAVAAPRYSASEISQMFSYIDRNKDGSISREEAASFPGVARHFDEADTNKDNALSREEFEAAMNKVK